MTRAQILKFFEEHPAILPREIGVQAGYPQGRTFLNWINRIGKMNQLIDVMPPVMESRICPVLDQYGFEAWLTEQKQKLK